MALRPLNAQEQYQMQQARTRLGLGPVHAPVRCSHHVQNIPRKGKGWIAKHLITPGTLIFAERPFFSVENIEANRNSAATQARIIDAVEHLTRARQAKYSKLAQPFHGRRMDDWVEIFHGNNFQMTTGRRQTQGIFLEASRINHSCIPNAWFNWNPHHPHPGSNTPGALTIYAIRNIQRGEEIVVNYHNGDAYQPANIRQDQLRGTYNFTCHCPACTRGGPHAVRRATIEWEDRNIQMNQGRSRDAAWERGHSLTVIRDLLKQEGLEYPYNADVHTQLAHLYIRAMNLPDADRWLCHSNARKNFQDSLDAEIIALGENSQETRNTLLAMRPVL
ncbi:MAG: hypothetical protein Q9168_000180 [Polycauliona sp. 1 TL-2023]